MWLHDIRLMLTRNDYLFKPNRQPPILEHKQEQCRVETQIGDGDRYRSEPFKKFVIFVLLVIIEKTQNAQLAPQP